MILIDHDMKCCGLVTAGGINSYKAINEFRQPTKKEINSIFDTIEKHQLEHRRNCAIISLAENQLWQIEEVEKRGWKRVFSFMNPNTHNQVHIYTKVLWETTGQYLSDVETKKYIVPDVDMWRQDHGSIEHAL